MSKEQSEEKACNKGRTGKFLLLTAGVSLGMAVSYLFGSDMMYAKARVDKFVIQNICSNYIPVVRENLYGLSKQEAQREIDNAVSECEKIIQDYERK